MPRTGIGDETWCHHLDPENKLQNQQWKLFNSPPLKKSKAVRTSTGKVIVTFFFDCRGPLLVDFLERGATGNAKFCADTLQKLRRAISQYALEYCRAESSFCMITPVPILPIWRGINFTNLAGKHFSILRTSQIFPLVTSTILAT